LLTTTGPGAILSLPYGPCWESSVHEIIVIMIKKIDVIVRFL